MAKPKKSEKKEEMSDIEKLAIQIVTGERQRWEDSVAFITENVAFKMRDLIRVCRKNYYGIFDEPFDETTGREKIWYPLSEIFVEASVKNYDLDAKDMNFKARNPKGYGVTDLVRMMTRNKLNKMYFGESLDKTERSLAIDGTAVWKTYTYDGKMKRADCDLLNVYIDPTSPSIQEAYRFTERSLQFSDEISKMSGWKNTASIEPVAGLPRIDPKYNQNTVGSNVKMLDVWETWGKVPLFLFTGNEEDRNTEVDGHLVVSGIESNSPRVHLIEKNTTKDTDGNIIKPYEEAWYKRVPGRWYGKGVVEQLMPFQLYANMTLNMRINRGVVSQLGLFKVRKGAGITPQMLSRLPSNGAVVLQNMDDIQQMVIGDISQSSYNDEKVIQDIAQRLTSAFDVVTGAALDASTPATNATIQDRNAKSMFSMIRKQLGSFLERWMNRHALPIIVKEYSIGDLVELDGGDEKIRELFETLVAYRAQEDLEEQYDKGYIPSELDLMNAMQRAASDMRKNGSLFVELEQEVVAKNVYCEVLFTNEAIDVSVITQNLLNMVNLAPEYRDSIIKEVFDLMGLDLPKASQPTPAQQSQGVGQQQGPNIPPQQLQQLVQQANAIPTAK